MHASLLLDRLVRTTSSRPIHTSFLVPGVLVPLHAGLVHCRSIGSEVCALGNLEVEHDLTLAWRSFTYFFSMAQPIWTHGS